MGLDIYLYTRKQEEVNNLHSEASDAFYEREDWPSTAEREAARAALPPYVHYDSIPSERYPEHLFNRRYLRSSYNGAGFNGAVPKMLGADRDLYWIFEPVRGDSEEYSFEFTAASVPGLEEAKARALRVAEDLRACDPLMATDASAMIGPQDHLWKDLPTQEEVLEWYRSEKARNASRDATFGEGYSSAKGTVFGFSEGLEVLALTLGRDVLGRPAAIAVFRSKAADSYIQSAEIVAEFCDEAMALIAADGSCFMHWSG